MEFSVWDLPSILIGRSVGLDKGPMEVYVMVGGIYYDLPFDWATQLLKEFLKSIENTNVVNGISCARCWSLILQLSMRRKVFWCQKMNLKLNS